MALKRKLGTVQLAAIIFFTISGGPFGIEPLVEYAGDHSLLLLAVTPILWDVPALLMVMELNSMMPVSGGYYQWVKRALGIRWAFYEGWWTWLYTFVDLAIYPVFLVEYATFFFPQIVAYKIPVCLAVIWCTALLNIRGVRAIGITSLALAVLVIAPIVLLFALGYVHPASVPADHPAPHSALGMALYTIIWNYIGWDNATTYASEVNKPAKTYIRAMLIAFAGIYFIYLGATYTALHTGLPAAQIAENGFPFIGEKVGGRWMGALLSAAGMASMLGIFNTILLSVSRVPAAMSNDQLLPAFISRHHPEYGTPYISITLCAIVVSLLIVLTFADLLIIDITLYGSGLALEFISLVVLRHKAPNEMRPFRIPLATPWLILVCCVPFVVFSVAIGSLIRDSQSGRNTIFLALIALASAEIGWMFAKRYRTRKTAT